MYTFDAKVTSKNAHSAVYRRESIVYPNDLTADRGVTRCHCPASLESTDHVLHMARLGKIKIQKVQFVLKAHFFTLL